MEDGWRGERGLSVKVWRRLSAMDSAHEISYGSEY